MRIFLDANILFSAAKSNGAMRRLLKALPARHHQLVADGYVIEEARRNLERKHPSAVACLDEILTAVDYWAKVCEPPFPEHLLILPEKDHPVLAAAIHLRCEILLTGDKMHFGDFFRKSIHGVTIHSPQTLAETLLGKSEI